MSSPISKSACAKPPQTLNLRRRQGCATRSAGSSRSISAFRPSCPTGERPGRGGRRIPGAVRQPDAPECRRVMWPARRCERERSAVPVGDAEPGAELTGGLPVPPIPKTALVTGGAQRIGRALALALAEDGFAVAVHHRRSGTAAEKLVEVIRSKGGTAVAVSADLVDEGAVKALLPRAEHALGPIGCLVNNAAVFASDTVETATRESWDLHVAVNLRAPFVLIQDFATRLPKSAGGVVVNLLDQRVWSLTPYFVSY